MTLVRRNPDETVEVCKASGEICQKIGGHFSAQPSRLDYAGHCDQIVLVSVAQWHTLVCDSAAHPQTEVCAALLNHVENETAMLLQPGRVN